MGPWLLNIHYNSETKVSWMAHIVGLFSGIELFIATHWLTYILHSTRDTISIIYYIFFYN